MNRLQAARRLVSASLLFSLLIATASVQACPPNRPAYRSSYQSSVRGSFHGQYSARYTSQYSQGYRAPQSPSFPQPRYDGGYAPRAYGPAYGVPNAPFGGYGPSY